MIFFRQNIGMFERLCTQTYRQPQPGTSAWDLIPVILTVNIFFTLQTTNHISNRFEVLTNIFLVVSPQTSLSSQSPPTLTCRGNLPHRCDKLQCFHSQSWNWKFGFNLLVTFNVDQLFLNCQTFLKCSQDYLAYEDIKAKLGDVGLILKLFRLISPALALPMHT